MPCGRPRALSRSTSAPLRRAARSAAFLGGGHLRPKQRPTTTGRSPSPGPLQSRGSAVSLVPAWNRPARLALLRSGERTSVRTSARRYDNECRDEGSRSRFGGTVVAQPGPSRRSARPSESGEAATWATPTFVMINFRGDRNVPIAEEILALPGRSGSLRRSRACQPSPASSPSLPCRRPPLAASRPAPALLMESPLASAQTRPRRGSASSSSGTCDC